MLLHIKPARQKLVTRTEKIGTRLVHRLEQDWQKQGIRRAQKLEWDWDKAGPRLEQDWQKKAEVGTKIGMELGQG